MAVVMAGDVLTLSLLRRVNKEAYQYGGLRVEGKYHFDVSLGWVRRRVFLERKYIKGDIETFKRDFLKTMNAGVYELIIF